MQETDVSLLHSKVGELRNGLNVANSGTENILRIYIALIVMRSNMFYCFVVSGEERFRRCS